MAIGMRFGILSTQHFPSSMTTLYPLKFEPIFKEKIWGGNKIKDLLGKDFSPLPNCGESWEISGVKGDISKVAEGPLAGQLLTELISTYKGNLLGNRVYTKYGDEFPLLIKFIDAQEDLSIQVHPNDALAKKRHSSFGKTEMWYIIQADERSTLISGFNRPLGKEEYLQHFKEGSLMEILNQEKVYADDVFFLPAGRVHTIGKGLLLAEIQQTSDITYRIYDFDRRDAAGNLRELHTAQAVDAIDYHYYGEYKTKYEDHPNTASEIVTSPYFVTNKLDLNEKTVRNHQGLDSFVILIALEGKAMLHYEDRSTSLHMGESILIPAEINNFEIEPLPHLKALETFIPQ